MKVENPFQRNMKNLEKKSNPADKMWLIKCEIGAAMGASTLAFDESVTAEEKKQLFDELHTAFQTSLRIYDRLAKIHG